eukprot:TRINITY_DN10149_c0_g2_i5.p1 TRINITY_DN10149_c0_g2~~TRINITY_DN10149_c0_g2_i5.p1  ORF type:complete len:342 (+),score=46.27 TRINITY_DN10149_c0_g2_i5:46-1026(+)
MAQASKYDTRHLRQDWNPLENERTEPLSAAATSRVRNDLKVLMKEPIPGIIIQPKGDSLGELYSLLVGPEGTPYEGGFFLVYCQIPSTYPFDPPRCVNLTNDRLRVRFNPNLYANGKICLSLLGTWTGPSWQSTLSLGSLMLSIQSLLSEKPYHNEPGYESERSAGQIEAYNLFLKHETLRVAVLGMLKGTATIDPVPEAFVNLMRVSFMDQIDLYRDLCRSNLHRTGQVLTDMFGSTVSASWEHMLKEIEQLYAHLKTLDLDQDDDDDGDDSDDSDDDDNKEEPERKGATLPFCSAEDELDADDFMHDDSDQGDDFAYESDTNEA